MRIRKYVNCLEVSSRTLVVPYLIERYHHMPWGTQEDRNRGWMGGWMEGGREGGREGGDSPNGVLFLHDPRRERDPKAHCPRAIGVPILLPVLSRHLICEPGGGVD